MNNLKIENESRRDFLKAGAGLTLALYFPVVSGTAEAADKAGAVAKFEPNAFVRIGSDNTVTVIAKHLEMGQGTYTGLSTLIADELDAAWAQIRVEGAPADARRYNNLNWGPMQGTGGSSAIANSFEQMRHAGATARAMLVAAAAKRWRVAAETIGVRQGVLTDAQGHRATFGELAADAAKLSVPDSVTLKSPRDFVYIGKQVPRKDSRAKVDGTAIYTQDIQLANMLVAVVAHAPRFGATLKSFDAAHARKVKGVVDVVAIPTGVAVLARNFWAANKGRDALDVVWDESAAFRMSSSEILQMYRELLDKPGAVARSEGQGAAALGGAAKQLSADYSFPYLAHAAMEPLDCVVRLGAKSCEIWNGEQSQTVDQSNVAKVVGLAPEQVKITMLYAGGSFGRRANPHSDYVVEAAQIAKAIHGRAPIKLVWTREDDMRAGYYRPAYVHRLAAALDASGNPVAWTHRIVGQSILVGTPLEGGMVKNGVDQTSVEGATNLPYAIPNLHVDLHSPTLAVPVQWWRAVGSTHTGFSTEAFIDELAHAANKDPVQFRRTLLAGQPRHLAALNLAADKAGWGAALAPGKAGEKRGRGIAVHESFNTVVAEVAEVTVKPDGSYHVDRVVCAVDCGIAVNPDVICAQMEGGIGFGLGAALYGEITLKDGRIEQSNFNDYPLLRINEMPQVEVHIVPSASKPSGVGEPGVPPIAPAVANALFAATGQRLRNLPLRLA
ncbi:Isoquinoline 1-oxidoreductase beta subunit [Georgfuchsia toluolica]|uniref:Isoquinoline 1-oxidoreductase beta subunit n=1 Tax=Georgfuchsia toluolica TaxID=424218 RepID=A0A916J1X2_9PROT|nr:xanthine dehydrogenase family protein molybdopterin-binding subunit [Georgfuchsia toluolica]CAG4882448.1 Isoquinoline 1-oxidoreductase beta subunit [Georgfuchsia toluolica]